MSRESPTSTERRDHLGDRWTALVVTVDAAADQRAKDASIPGVEFGRFELLEHLGSGGMGVVFRARDTKLDRDVALKLWTLPSEEADAAVLHEAQCLAKLSHPNVVAFYDTGKTGNDVFLTMELVSGMDGRQWIGSFFPSWQEIVNLYVGAGRGLAAAHAAGLEHGDFKPENVLLGEDRRVRVADFGIARVLRDQINADDDNMSARDDSGRAGTLSYMAPERLRRRRGDARSDQFSFCVSVWEALYGADPFAGETASELLESMVAGELQTGVSVLGIPRRLRQVIAKGLSLNPADRWPDMASLLDAMTETRKRAEQRGRRLRVGVVAAGMAVGSSLATAAIIVSRVPAHAPAAPEVVDARPIAPAPVEPPAKAPVDDTDADPATNVVPDIIALLESDDLDGAHDRWSEAHASAWMTHTPIGNEAFAIAQAFLNRARMHEHVNPERASAAARYARSVGSFASVNLLPGSAEQRGLAELLEESARLISRVTQLVGEFSQALDAEASFDCGCDDNPGYSSAEECHRARGVGPEKHACLAALVKGHEDAIQRHLECVVPVLEAYSTCAADMADCRSDALADCRASRQRDEGTCPQLPENLQRAFADCIR